MSGISGGRFSDSSTWIATLGVIGMVVFDVILVLYLNPKINRKYAMNLWNDRIPLHDVDGSTIKVPIRYQEGDEIKVKEEIAPLWLTVAYSLGRFGTEQMKLWFMSQKAAVGKKLDAAALAKLKTGELSVEEIALEVVPKKWQKYIAGYQLIKEVMGKNDGGSAAPSSRSTSSAGSFKPGMR